MTIHALYLILLPWLAILSWQCKSTEEPILPCLLWCGLHPWGLRARCGSQRCWLYWMWEGQVDVLFFPSMGKSGVPPECQDGHCFRVCKTVIANKLGWVGSGQSGRLGLRAYWLSLAATVGFKSRLRDCHRPRTPATNSSFHMSFAKWRARQQPCVHHVVIWNCMQCSLAPPGWSASSLWSFIHEFGPVFHSWRVILHQVKEIAWFLWLQPKDFEGWSFMHHQCMVLEDGILHL